jgi:amidase
MGKDPLAGLAVDCQLESSKAHGSDAVPRAASVGGDAQLCTSPLTEVAKLIETRKVSAVEITRAMLDRIANVDTKLHSYITLTRDLALEQAARADQEISQGKYRGPLHGMPIAVKDLVFTKGIRTTAGSKILANWVPSHDATVMTKLYEAGAVLLGKLSMTEFAGIAYHPSVVPPANPWDLERWPGASSSGAGVAIAASLCFGSIGSDTGGSIRFPSAACGVVGVKPTYGRVSRYGIFNLAESLDHVGPITRSVEDAAVMLRVIAGFDPLDPTTRREEVPDYLGDLHAGVKGLRLGVDEAFCTARVNAEVGKALLAVGETMGELGADIHSVSITGLQEATKIWGTIFAAEGAAAHEQIYIDHAQDYNPAFKAFLENAFKVRGLDYARAHANRQRVSRVMEDLFQEVDLLLWPAMGTVAMRMEEFAPDGIISPEQADDLLRFTAPLSLTGSPTLSLPCGFDHEGMPMGLQLVASHGEESILFRAGFAYEEATEWHRKRPLV